LHEKEDALENLIKSISFKENKIISVVRFLMDQKIIAQDKQMKLHWNDTTRNK
jgi:hypothetical protein